MPILAPFSWCNYNWLVSWYKKQWKKYLFWRTSYSFAPTLLHWYVPKVASGPIDLKARVLSWENSRQLQHCGVAAIESTYPLSSPCVKVKSAIWISAEEPLILHIPRALPPIQRNFAACVPSFSQTFVVNVRYLGSDINAKVKHKFPSRNDWVACQMSTIDRKVRRPL
jgi:hypothetical protein